MRSAAATCSLTVAGSCGFFLSGGPGGTARSPQHPSEDRVAAVWPTVSGTEHSPSSEGDSELLLRPRGWRFWGVRASFSDVQECPPHVPPTCFSNICLPHAGPEEAETGLRQVLPHGLGPSSVTTELGVGAQVWGWGLDRPRSPEQDLSILDILAKTHGKSVLTPCQTGAKLLSSTLTPPLGGGHFLITAHPTEVAGQSSETRNGTDGLA